MKRRSSGLDQSSATPRRAQRVRVSGIHAVDDEAGSSASSTTRPRQSQEWPATPLPVPTPATAYASSSSGTLLYSSPRLPPSSRSRNDVSLHTPTSSTVASTPRGHICHQASDHRDGSVDMEPADDMLNETILAMELKQNDTVGCAYYVALSEQLFIQEDIPVGGMNLVETLLLHVQPTSVLIPNRSPDRLVEYLSSRAQSGYGTPQEEDEIRVAWILRSLGSHEFNCEAAKDWLVGLDLELFSHQSMRIATVAEADASAELSRKQGRLMRLASCINFDSVVSVGCAGALLNELHRRRAAAYLPRDPDAVFAFRIKTIDMLTLADSMFMNADALTSLQILRAEHHPNKQMQGPDRSQSRAKESLSIFGLVQSFASTPQGKVILRQIFLRPSVDLDVIRERQRSIAVLLRPENTQAVTTAGRLLRKIKDARPQLLRLRKGVALANSQVATQHDVWTFLSQFARFVIELLEAVRSLAGGERLVIVSKMTSRIESRDIIQVGELIHQLIDFDQSKETNRTAVKQGVDADLDAFKRHYDGLGDFLSRVGAHVCQSVPEWARGYIQSCIFYPQLGFLVAVSLNVQTGRGNYDGEGSPNDVWEPMFTNEGYVYYKTHMMKELDSEVGDVYCMIVDKEIELIHGLGLKILEREHAMVTASELCGELDSLIALAMSAEKYNWTPPRVTRANVIDISNGRHPLQELVVPSFIANDSYLVGGTGSELPDSPPGTPTPVDKKANIGPSMMVITGPNHSGKSVYLKQVALIVYLAHIGSYVPADRATIGLTDRILTRVATRESVSRNESSFAIDLRQIAFAMHFAARRSLILIDEFGKGTNANDGAGLMTGLLTHLLSLGDERPRVLVATHFHEIFENRFLEPRTGLAFANMEIRLSLEEADEDDQVTYLYRLVPGRSTASFGSRCASLNGVDRAVVERAEDITLLMVRNGDLEAACTKISTEEETLLDQAEFICRGFLEMVDTLRTHHPVGALRAGQRMTPSVREELHSLLLMSAFESEGMS